MKAKVNERLPTLHTITGRRHAHPHRPPAAESKLRDVQAVERCDGCADACFWEELWKARAERLEKENEQLWEEIKALEGGRGEQMTVENEKRARPGDLIKIKATGETKKVRFTFLGGVHICDSCFTSVLDNEYLVLKGGGE